MFSSIGFIGTGTMGAAVARAAVKGAQGAPVLLANRTRSKAEAVARELGAQTADNETVARECSLIFLGVKPQMMEQMLSGLVPILKARKDRFVLASMAAGLDARRIQEMAGGAYPVICLMPNTPVAVGAGVVQYYGVDATEEELSDFQNLLSAAGMIDRVDPERHVYRSPCGWQRGLRPAPGQGAGLCGQDGGGHGPADAGEPRPPRPAEGRSVLPRRNHHPGRTHPGGPGLPLRGDRSGHRRL